MVIGRNTKKDSMVCAVATLLCILVGLSLFFGVSRVSAHDFGESFELETEDGVLVDIGYSVEDFTDDTSVIFVYELKDEEKNNIPFSDVWVRIIRDKTTVFASGIHNARLGGALMTYTFPSTGEYVLSVRYQDDGESVVEAEFPLTVMKGESRSRGGSGALYASAGFVGGLVFGLIPVILRRRND